MKNNKYPIINMNNRRSFFAEAYRELRTNLNFLNTNNSCRSLVITSPGVNEGKSTVAANLAIVLSQANYKVLLVDSDLRRPSQHLIFGLDNSKGLTNFLLCEDSVDGYTNKVMEGLWIITAGTIPPNPSEIISLNKTKQFWERQLKKYDYVIIDTPPILAVTDAALLASQVHGAILVVNASTTRIDIAQDAIGRLTKVNVRIIGIVLNQVKKQNQDYYFYNYS